MVLFAPGPQAFFDYQGRIQLGFFQRYIEQFSKYLSFPLPPNSNVFMLYKSNLLLSVSLFL